MKNKTIQAQQIKAHQENFSTLPQALVILLACAAGLSVANVYYAQPLLDLFAQDFKLSYSWAGLIVSLTQIGSIIALIFIVPLGDLLQPKRLILLQILSLCVSLVLLIVSKHIVALFASILLVGMLGTAMTQGLIVYASVLAPAEARGKVVGTVQAGVLLGILLSRVVAGTLADWFGWQGTYVFSLICMSMTCMLLWKFLPMTFQGIASSKKPSYLQIIFSVFEQLYRHRVLQIRGLLALIIFINLNLFWNALVFPLSIPPFEYSHRLIGWLGAIGAIGAVMAIRIGVLADRGYAQQVTQFAFLLMIISWWVLSRLYFSIWIFILGIVLLDVAIQAVHVINQSLIFQADIQLHGRLVGAYMLFYALGSSIGSILATTLYSSWGWSAVCLAGGILSLVGYLFWYLTRGIVVEWQKSMLRSIAKA
ncbi:MFS transporter [Acinetobacter bereziniae]|uniref:MFS transporter n=1 Tax=Acinetobacter bereziniae TaxID=106648 RepID=UPI0015810F72|nr:MFS transporter [Acinetobacter bereziniae]NUF64331.1 MFS transporter [Acinetobacter bereziniae]NUG07836.1 MFS transporter [Acinetobacter bereziniae]NUG62941.1 MFS transporter [Acinetobacter bereziniae]NUG70757.1 MFS transporter [Acinetobacter bereziniae]NUG79026.1 MFS transporter [Acinetobacter bereziniae]